MNVSYSEHVQCLNSLYSILDKMKKGPWEIVTLKIINKV